MRVFVNDRAVDMLPGMKIRHALISAGFLRRISIGERVYDEWGNELGLDGTLSEGMRITRGGTSCRTYPCLHQLLRSDRRSSVSIIYIRNNERIVITSVRKGCFCRLSIIL
jgi:hypothetical protein